MQPKFYAGVGSRDTPPLILRLMSLVSSKLEEEGWILRSGGARGADSAFERGVRNKENMQIFLPGSSFQGRVGNSRSYIDATALESYQAALKTVYKFHPTPHKLTDFPRKLMARNAMQVLGPDLETPSSYVIAWTPSGEVCGGTGQALRMATSYGIPIINLGCEEGLQSAEHFLFGKPLQ